MRIATIFFIAAGIGCSLMAATPQALFQVTNLT